MRIYLSESKLSGLWIVSYRKAEITIPKEIIVKLGLSEGDKLIILTALTLPRYPLACRWIYL